MNCIVIASNIIYLKMDLKKKKIYFKNTFLKIDRGFTILHPLRRVMRITVVKRKCKVKGSNINVIR